MAELWDAMRTRNRAAAEPLAWRMRPRTLAQFVGQTHFLGPGRRLRRMIEADQISSVLLYGPPGTGKTTLAEVIAQATQRRFIRSNAAAVGVKEIRAFLDEARRELEDGGRRTVLFLDEIHRFSKAQQDVLLSDVERGIITLIGATTENPFFSVNSALVSRSQIFAFEPLTEAEIRLILGRAVEDAERGLGGMVITLEEEAANLIAAWSDGDARRALTALEIAACSATPDEQGRIVIDRQAAEESMQRKALVFDAAGDEHYDMASALIKSMRGSDPDAAIYWLARMLVAGEDPRFIARRIAILASEDIGNADPRALEVAHNAWSLAERIGMPECQLTLAQAVIYMATAPKSQASARAIWQAMEEVKTQRTLPVPRDLRDGHYAGAAKLGHAQGYDNPHQSEQGWVDQSYLGVDRRYYVPTGRGHEKRIADFLAWIQQQRQASKEKPPTLEPRPDIDQDGSKT
ncbi:MAG: replication-associated recombination protein A [Phycisphaeraceae bacterium]|nr:replication-associated recombination protein A [Phycisphaeraceae bacterium]